jgi:two-component system, sensor histidine kinase LadS
VHSQHASKDLTALLSIFKNTLNTSMLLRFLFTILTCMFGVGLAIQAHAQSAASATGSREVTQQADIWIDDRGSAQVEQLAASTSDVFQPLGQSRSFSLAADSALWMRLSLPAADPNERWYLQLSSAAALDQATFYQRSESGQWTTRRAGDRLAVATWDLPEQTPVFQVNLEAATTVWLRLESYPATIAPRLQLLTQHDFDTQRRWSYLLLGAYFGFGVLVLILGIVHARLYADRAFVIYSIYVTCMLMFQLAFTGIGGLYFWPHSPAWNNAAPGIFMLIMASMGIWFVREATDLVRYSKFIDKAVMAAVTFGLLFAFVYTGFPSKGTFLILNVYALISVVFSVSVCWWVWRRGERYGAWVFLGFLPVYLGYPFPALRSAGLIADNWLSQYAVLIGSAIEIPLLLYVLHRRAKEFNENRARMRAVDQTDPLTGLAMPPVLALRMIDALRRSRKHGHDRTLMLVELVNHEEIVQKEGRTLGDRALVVAASRILSALDDVDTVCRVDNTQFAVLVENLMSSAGVNELAQKIIVRGLTEPADKRSSKPLQFRIVTSTLKFNPKTPTLDDSLDVDDVLKPLVRAMERLVQEPQKAILHLSEARSKY